MWSLPPLDWAMMWSTVREFMPRMISKQSPVQMVLLVKLGELLWEWLVTCLVPVGSGRPGEIPAASAGMTEGVCGASTLTPRRRGGRLSPPVSSTGQALAEGEGIGGELGGVGGRPRGAPLQGREGIGRGMDGWAMVRGTPSAFGISPCKGRGDRTWDRPRVGVRAGRDLGVVAGLDGAASAVRLRHRLRPVPGRRPRSLRRPSP